MNDPLDDRVTCTACRHLWPGNRCLNHRHADLNERALAADFTALLQRCPGYAPKARAQAPPMHTPAPTPKTETKTDARPNCNPFNPSLKATTS